MWLLQTCFKPPSNAFKRKLAIRYVYFASCKQSENGSWHWQKKRFQEKTFLKIEIWTPNYQNQKLMFPFLSLLSRNARDEAEPKAKTQLLGFIFHQVPCILSKNIKAPCFFDIKSLRRSLWRNCSKATLWKRRQRIKEKKKTWSPAGF